MKVDLRLKGKFSAKEHFLRYGLTVVLVLLTFACKSLIYVIHPQVTYPFLLASLPIVLAGLIAGLGPSIAAALMSAPILGVYFGSTGFDEDTIDLSSLIEFFLASALLIWVLELERRARVKLSQMNRALEKEVRRRTGELENKKQELAEMNKRLTGILQKTMDERPRSRVD